MLMIERAWAMPNKNTFEIKPIRIFIEENLDGTIILNPFANRSTYGITNDIDPQYNTDYNMDALDFLKIFSDNSVDFILYDPPFTPRQIAESYKKFKKTVNMETTQASYWANHKREISRISKLNSKVITFGWNSGGIGKKYGFEIKKILLVAHGSWHNDTICTLEHKTNLTKREEGHGRKNT